MDIAYGSRVEQRPGPVVGIGAVRTIEVVRGVGRGPTKLAAFDAALRQAGVANFNLIVLSSVIPPGATVQLLPESGRAQPRAEWGDRLYVVMADMRVDQPGQQAWAGIGWVQQESSGRGLFAEHYGHSEGEVRRDLEATLTSMAAARPQALGPPRYAVQGAACDGEPACALVLAVYESAPWSEPVIELT